MTPGRDLADRLAAVASRYTPDARKAKLELLARLETARVGPAAALLRLHEALCFLQAYPDDAEVLARVDRALAAFPARVTRLGAPARRARSPGSHRRACSSTRTASRAPRRRSRGRSPGRCLFYDPRLGPSPRR